MLRWHVGAQTHGRQHLQPFNIAFGMFLRPVKHHPALTETRHAVSFREAVKGDGQQIGRQRGDRVVLRFVIQDLVVNFVGENDQVMLSRDLNDLQQQLFTVNRAGGIVRVNDDDAARAWRDFTANIVKIREPV